MHAEQLELSGRSAVRLPMVGSASGWLEARSMQTIVRPVNRLLLLRHAHSAWPKPGESDFDRQLDETGRDEAISVGRLATEHGLSPDVMICSPALRCRQTAALFLTALPVPPQVAYDPALYSEDVEHYLAVCKTAEPGETLMIIGHNPMMEETFIRLVGSEASTWHIPSGFPTAALAVFVGTMDEPWRLETLLTP
jgi:phosphohistidine phosphatase